MALTLALLEASLFFAAVCSTIFLWGEPILLDWIDVATVLGQACVVSLCCIVSFYYNDLYDFRKVRSFVEFASRLLQSFGLALILLSAFYILSPETSIDGRLFVWTLLIIVGLLLPLRAVWYGLMRSRRLAARVLILGTSSLAHYIIREIESHLYFRYAIVGWPTIRWPPQSQVSAFPCWGLSIISTRSSRRSNPTGSSSRWPNGGGGCQSTSFWSPRHVGSWLKKA